MQTQPDQARSQEKNPARPSETKGVAVVDDEPAVRVSLRYIINSIEGFRCCGEYASAEAALACIPGSETRIVFMDLQMPGMSGIECTRRLLRLAPTLQVIIVTGVEDPGLLRQCLRVGAVHFLTKPVSLSTCRAAVRLFGDTGSVSGPRPPLADHLHADHTQHSPQHNHRRTGYLELSGLQIGPANKHDVGD